jgi:hypothetical protein
MKDHLPVAHRDEWRLAIALRFTQLLRYELSGREFAELVALNKAEPSLGVCHSHDYIDANTVMEEAFRDVMGRGPFTPSGVEADDADPAGAMLLASDTALFNNAWALARAAWGA